MKRSLALLALLGICACAPVGPNYQLPAEATVNTPAARGAFIAASAQAVAANPVPEGWWRLYDDPILNDLEREALAANTDLRVAAANLARAVATQNEVEGAREAKIGGSFAAERAQLSGEAYLLPVPLPSQYLEDGDVHLSYQLDLFGRLKTGRRGGASRQRGERPPVSIWPASPWPPKWLAPTPKPCAAGEELNTQQRTVDLQNRARTVTAKLAAAGRDSTIEVTRANASYDQARAALPALQARRQVALFRLAILTGHPPAEYPRAVEACVAPPRFAPPHPGRRRRRLAKAPTRCPSGRENPGRRHGPYRCRHGGRSTPTSALACPPVRPALLADVGQAAAQRWSVGSLISWTLARRHRARPHRRGRRGDRRRAGAFRRRRAERPARNGKRFDRLRPRSRIATRHSSGCATRRPKPAGRPKPSTKLGVVPT